MPLDDEIRYSNFVGKIGTVAGWGIMQTNTTVRPKILQHTEVVVLENSTCWENYGSTFTNASEICSWTLDHHSGSCDGDSGMEV